DLVCPQYFNGAPSQCVKGQCQELPKGTCRPINGNADCVDAAAPLCNSLTKQCVQCLDDSVCAGLFDGGPAQCLTGTGKCSPVPNETCRPQLGNADCVAPAQPICDPANSACVQCLMDATCVPIITTGPSYCSPGGQCLALTPGTCRPSLQNADCI